MQAQINALRKRWNELTGQDIRERPFERIGYEFLKDFTVEDMEQVVTFTLHQNGKREMRFRDIMRFDRILADPETFEARRAEAAAWHRNRRKAATEREKTVAAFRSVPVQEGDNGKTRRIGEVFRGLGEINP